MDNFTDPDQGAEDKLQEGTLIGGRYLLKAALGQGGMGEVWLAEDITLQNRKVAVKFLLAHKSLTEDAQRRFQNELKSMIDLQHPHIVRIHDAGDFEGLPYYVMEYFDGGTLANVSTPLDWKYAAQLLLPAAKALETAHNNKFVHRDIKPANLLVRNKHTQTPELVVSDFGIAKKIYDDETRDELAGRGGLTKTGIAIGTVAYMSPEQAQASKNISGKTDVYSLGIVFYELLTGRRPYTGATPESESVQAIISKKLPDPRNYAKDLPPMVYPVLQRALQKDPAQRSSMSEFRQALEGIIEGKAVQPAASWMGCARNFALVYFGAFLSLLVVIGIAWFVLSNTSQFANANGSFMVSLFATQTPTFTPTPKATLTPTITPTPTLTSTPTITPTPDCAHDASFVGDVTIPANSQMSASSEFTKTWLIRNSGNCAWVADFQMVLVEGVALSAGQSHTLNQEVPPGETVQISLNLVAPSSPGSYQSRWKLVDNNGNQFGQAFETLIVVPTATAVPSSGGGSIGGSTGGTYNGAACPYPGDRWGRDVWAAFKDQLGCATQNRHFSPQAVYQRFSSGMMIWEAQTDRVYVLFNSGGFSYYNLGSAPSGYQSPNNPNLKGAIGWVYDTYASVRSLGSPTMAETTVSSFDIQYFQGGMILYFPERGNYTLLYSGRWIRNN